MKTLIPTLIISCMALLSGCARDDSLAYWVNNQRHGASVAHPSVAVSAIVKDSKTISFRITNLADRDLEVIEEHLPWTNPNNLELLGITASGRIVRCPKPIADTLRFDKVAFPAHGTLSGDYSLDVRFDEALSPKEDVLILWSYEVPKELSKETAFCNGFIIIQKKE